MDGNKLVRQGNRLRVGDGGRDTRNRSWGCAHTPQCSGYTIVPRDALTTIPSHLYMKRLIYQPIN
jgi:hypothetical protein